MPLTKLGGLEASGTWDTERRRSRPHAPTLGWAWSPVCVRGWTLEDGQIPRGKQAVTVKRTSVCGRQAVHSYYKHIHSFYVFVQLAEETEPRLLTGLGITENPTGKHPVWNPIVPNTRFHVPSLSGASAPPQLLPARPSWFTR